MCSRKAAGGNLPGFPEPAQRDAPRTESHGERRQTHQESYSGPKAREKGRDEMRPPAERGRGTRSPQVELAADAQRAPDRPPGRCGGGRRLSDLIR
ncbi:hypothetical protein EYF80_036550 [Liparis tanakae]|uniref:Uncharacterized protein n=1 Tax=Liparis tanakae TaxID=230148 RepID=A0A4Z2GIT4_9TELE|nr:hypothetical protein EYF80_036550 [Liparis tanakae]